MSALGSERVRVSFRREWREIPGKHPLTGQTCYQTINVLEWLRIRNPRDGADRAAFRLLARDSVGKDQGEADRIFHAHRTAGSALWRPSGEGEREGEKKSGNPPHKEPGSR